jgi:hypothetical protein
VSVISGGAELVISPVISFEFCLRLWIRRDSADLNLEAGKTIGHFDSCFGHHLLIQTENIIIEMPNADYRIKSWTEPSIDGICNETI